jgi:hypothetical protein
MGTRMSEEQDVHHDLKDSELESDIKNYLRDKERIRQILGRVGGVPKKKQRIVNVAFIALVSVAFVLGLVVGDRENIFLDIAILLVSLKLIYVVGQNIKVNHFQFWMLTTLEWRLNEMTQDLKDIRKKIDAQD